MNLDNIEVLSIERQTKNFPLHYHETFCFTLIKNGTFQTTFEDKICYSEFGALAISNPFELHSNPILDKSCFVSFSTIYISEDLVTNFLKTKSIRFENKVIIDIQLALSFNALEKALKTKCFVAIEKTLKIFLNELSRYTISDFRHNNKLNFGRFDEINEFIESNIKTKISLSEMANIANLNKFSFIKNFKQSSGMTPSQYVLMKKIFSSKADFLKYENFTEIAYDYNFTDLAHWSNSFKRYIGITPSEYKKTIED